MNIMQNIYINNINNSDHHTGMEHLHLYILLQMLSYHAPRQWTEIQNNKWNKS